MFKKNKNTGQTNLFDPYHTFPEYVKTALEKSWANYFYHHVFKKINEERFSVLYSDNYSRPNTPVNILIGLLFLKELNQWTDEELISALFFDYRVQYAMGITDFEKERICVNTLSNFRVRLYKYAKDHDKDLLHEEVDALTQELIKTADMDTSLARQDSMMVSANCKKMGRVEIIYTANKNMIKALAKLDKSLIPESLIHYQNDKDKNDQIYRIKEEEVNSKLQQLLDETFQIQQAVPENHKDTDEFLTLTRLIDEQLDNPKEGPVPKENKKISSNSLQNPSEPDATYRNKAGKKNTGYALNAVEARDQEKKMSMILHHELQPNTVSDVELGGNALDQVNGVEKMACDGAYYSTDNNKKAEEKGIKTTYSAISGRKVKDNILGVNQFDIDPDTRKITSCPAGVKPISAKYDSEKEVYTAKFPKNICLNCPLLDVCPVNKKQKKYNVLRFTENKLQADKCRSEMNTDTYKMLADFRAGVEGIPSVLRRSYGIDKIPVRGLIRSRLWSSCKVMMYNFSSFMRYLLREGVSPSFLNYLYFCLAKYFDECRLRFLSVGVNC